MAPPLVSQPYSGRRQPLLGKRALRLQDLQRQRAEPWLLPLLFEVVVKLPASLCKRTLRRKKREKKGKQDVHPVRPAPTWPENLPKLQKKSSKKQVEEMDGMWEKMHTGFWKSIQ
ncbi:hypothetical protein AMTRI_Chr10g229950 [Amborella trichopoda]